MKRTIDYGEGLKYQHEFVSAQADIVSKSYEHMPHGGFMNSGTGTGKTGMMFGLARCYFQAKEGMGTPHSKATILVTSASLVQQQQRSGALAGFKHVFPPESKNANVNSHLMKWIESVVALEGKGVEMAIVMSTNSFARAFNTCTAPIPSQWLQQLVKSCRCVVVLLDEVHSLLKGKSQPPKTVSTCMFLADYCRERNARFAVYGSSASLHEGTELGRMMASPEEVCTEEGYVLHRLASRATMLAMASKCVKKMKRCECGDISEEAENYASMRVKRLPFFCASAESECRLKQELNFSGKPEFTRVRIPSEDMVNLFKKTTLRVRALFLASVLTRDKVHPDVRKVIEEETRVKPAQFLKELKVSLWRFACNRALRDMVAEGGEMEKDACEYSIRGVTKSRCVVYAVSCASKVGCSILLDLFQKHAKEAEIANVMDIGIEGRNFASEKAVKFAAVESLICGDDELPRGRVVVVCHPELMQGHDGFHLLFDKLFLVGFDDAAMVQQAVGRFDRACVNPEVRVLSKQEVVHYEFDALRELERRRADLNAKVASARNVGGDVSGVAAEEVFEKQRKRIFDMNEMSLECPWIRPDVFWDPNEYDVYADWMSSTNELGVTDDHTFVAVCSDSEDDN